MGCGEYARWGSAWVGRIVGEWLWAWIRYVLVREGRRGEVVWVNAAMREGEREGEGENEEGWVVGI